MALQCQFAGDILKFEIKIENKGDSKAYNVKASDIFGEGLKSSTFALDPIAQTWITTDNSELTSKNKVTFTVNEIDADSSKTITYKVNVADEIGGLRDFQNSAKLVSYQKSGTGSTIYEPKKDDTAVVYLRTVAPTISKSVVWSENTPLRLGDSLVYQIDVTVPDKIALYNAKILDTLPDTQIYISSGGSHSEGTVSGTSGNNYLQTVTFTPNATVTGSSGGTTLTYYVKAKVKTSDFVGTSSTQINTAKVSWDDKSSGGQSHSSLANANANIKKPNLTATLTASSSTLITGQTVDYTYTITNNGANTAYNFKPTITIPSGLTPSEWKLGGTDITPTPTTNNSDGTTTYTFNPVSDLSSNAGTNSKIITFKLIPENDLAAGVNYNVKASTGDYYTRQSEGLKLDAVSSTSTLSVPSVRITKIAKVEALSNSTTQIRPNDIATYEITVVVDNGTVAYNAKLTDVLPAGFEIVEADGLTKDNTDPNGKTYYVDLGKIDAKNAQVTKTYTIKARAIKGFAFISPTDSKTNTASIVWNTVYNMPSTQIQRQATATLDVIQPSLSITSFTPVGDMTTHQSGAITFNNAENAQVTFTGVVKNSGTSTAHKTKIVATIPKGLSAVTGTYGDGILSTNSDGSSTITWDKSISATATETLAFQLKKNGEAVTSYKQVKLEIVEYFSAYDSNSKKYQPSEKVIPINTAPTASGNTHSIDEDTDLTSQQLVANDVDGDTLKYSVITPPTSAQGTFEIDNSGFYSFYPAKDYNGTVTVTVRVDDGKGGQVDVAIKIIVKPVNDPPTVPNYTHNVKEGASAISGQVIGSDVDGDTLTYTLDTNNDATKGTLVFNSNGTYTYTPVYNFVGTNESQVIDTFKVKVSDGKGGVTTNTVTNPTVKPLALAMGI